MGCVLDWFMRKVVGLKEIKPGFQEVEIKPQIKGIVDDFQMKYLSENGLFTIKLLNGKYEFTIPEGCKAIVNLPDSAGFLKKYPEAKTQNIGISVKSGTYQWEY